MFDPTYFEQITLHINRQRGVIEFSGEFLTEEAYKALTERQLATYVGGDLTFGWECSRTKEGFWGRIYTS